MAVVADQAALLEVLMSFSRQAAGDFQVTDILTDLARSAGRVLAIDGAGVDYLVGERMRFVHASSELARAADRVEVQLQQGPCQDARAQRKTVVEPDLAQTTLWPQYSPRAVAVGVRAVAAVPLLARGKVWGALDLYRAQPGPFAVDDLQVAQVLADIAVGYLVMAHDRDLARAAQDSTST